MKKTIMITEASFGIRKVACLHFAAKGCNVIASMNTFICTKELIAHSSILVKQMDVADIYKH